MSFGETGRVRGFLEFYTQYYPALISFAQRRERGDPDAEDVVQEAFLKLWQNRDAVQNWRAWLYAAVRNLVVSKWRERQSLRRGGNLERVEFDEELCGTVSEQHDVWDDIRYYLGLLTPSQREAVVALYCGYALQEISTLQERSRGAVKQSLYRARKKVREVR